MRPLLLLTALAAASAAALPAPRPHPPSPLADANPACDVCTWAWQTAQDALADPDAQRALLRFVEGTLCPAFPGGDAQAQCVQLAREYVPSAIAALESFTPKEACSTVGVCPTAVGAVRAGCGGRAAAAGAARVGGLPCPMCRLTLNNIKLQLEDPANEADLVGKAHTVREEEGRGRGGGRGKKKALGWGAGRPTPLPRLPQVCAAMPSDVGAACDEWVNTNSESLFWAGGGAGGGTRALSRPSRFNPPHPAPFPPGKKVFAVIADFDPNRLCTIVGACPPNASPPADDAAALATALRALPPRPAVAPAHRASLDGDASSCDTCKSVVASLAAAVADDARDAAAVESIKRVCDAFHAFRDDCVAAIDGNADAVVAFLKANLTPDLCAKVGACPPSGGGGGRVDFEVA